MTSAQSARRSSFSASAIVAAATSAARELRTILLIFVDAESTTTFVLPAPFNTWLAAIRITKARLRAASGHTLERCVGRGVACSVLVGVLGHVPSDDPQCRRDEPRRPMLIHEEHARDKDVVLRDALRIGDRRHVDSAALWVLVFRQSSSDQGVVRCAADVVAG